MVSPYKFASVASSTFSLLGQFSWCIHRIEEYIFSFDTGVKIFLFLFGTCIIVPNVGKKQRDLTQKDGLWMDLIQMRPTRILGKFTCLWLCGLPAQGFIIIIIIYEFFCDSCCLWFVVDALYIFLFYFMLYDLHFSFVEEWLIQFRRLGCTETAWHPILEKRWGTNTCMELWYF